MLRLRYIRPEAVDEKKGLCYTAKRNKGQVSLYRRSERRRP